MAERNVGTPYDAVRTYLSGLPKSERRVVLGHATQLHEQGNDAFRIGDFDALVVIPMLITEEGNVTRTLGFIRDQGINVGVVLSANIPRGGNRMEPVLRNVKDIVEEGVHGSGLPMSYFLEAYQVGTPIGAVLRDLYGASLQHMVAVRGRYLRNIPIIRMDADPVSMPNNYFPRIFEEWEKDPEMSKMAYPLVQHDRLDPKKFSNINRLLDWYDLFLGVTQSIVSAHFAVDLQAYAASGGTPADIADAEVGYLMRQIDATADIPDLSLHHLPDIAVYVSSRRIAKRSATEGLPVYDSLYVSSDDHPTHRNQPPAQDISDIEYRRQNGWQVFRTVQLFGDRLFLQQLAEGVSDDTAKEFVMEQMREFGEEAMRTFGDPPEMYKVLDAAIRQWPKDGLPAGKPRRKTMLPKIRNIIPDPSAGGEGILYQR